MRIPDATISHIIDRVSIADVVGEYSSLRQRGDRFWGLCPFHTEKTPSFSVSPDKSAFYCFGCGKGGGLIQFVMDVEKLPFPEAVVLLAERAGIHLEDNRGSESGIRRQEYVELNSRIAATFNHMLLTGGEAVQARDYLEQRGIDKSMVAAFNLGWSPASGDWLLQFLRGKQFSDEFLSQSGLFVKRNRDLNSEDLRPLFRGRVMFPIVNVRGEVIAFGGRILASERGPKYVNSAETPFFRKQEQLFGLNHALQLLKKKNSVATTMNDHDFTRGLPCVVVVEGYTDVISLTGIGVPSVATLGTAFGDAHARIFKRLQLSVVVMFDADEAGRNAAIRSLKVLAAHDVPAAVVPLPEEKDPADLVASGGKKELKKMLDSPMAASQYIIKVACAGKNLAVTEGKEQAFSGVFSYIKEIESIIIRDAVLQELAANLRLDYDTIRTEFERRIRAIRGAKRDYRISEPISSVSMLSGSDRTGAELRLMLAVAVNRELFSLVRARLDADEIEDGRARSLYIALEDCFRHNQADTETLLLKIESEELRAIVAEKLSIDEFTINAQAYVDEGVHRVKYNSLKRKRALVMESVRQAEHSGASDVLNGLLADKIYLDSELEKLRGEVLSG